VLPTAHHLHHPGTKSACILKLKCACSGIALRNGYKLLLHSRGHTTPETDVELLAHYSCFILCICLLSACSCLFSRCVVIAVDEIAKHIATRAACTSCPFDGALAQARARDARFSELMRFERLPVPRAPNCVLHTRLNAMVLRGI